MSHRGVSLAESPVCVLLQSPKALFSSLWSWEEMWGLQDIPVSRGQSERCVSGGPGKACAVAFGLLLSVICGLHRGPLGPGDLDFHGATEALPQRLSGELGREAHTGDSFVLLPPLLREGASQTERQRPPPSCLRAAGSLWRDWGFQDTCHMLRGPKKEKFP